MPYRRLPISDATLTVALQRADTKLQAIAAPDRPVAAATVAAVHEFLHGKTGTNWLQLQLNVGVALAAQGTATTAYQQAFATSALYISHFVQVLNLAILRGELPAQARAYYGFDLSDDRVPKLEADADLQLWGPRLIAGEAARVAAGGEPMQFPNIAAVESKYNAFVTAGETSRAAQTEYQRRLDLVAGQRAEAERLVTEVWDDVENHYRRETPSAKRRLCRQYGVVYVAQTDDKTFDGTLEPGASAVVLRRALPPTTALRVTNASATASLLLCAAPTEAAACPAGTGVEIGPGETRDLTRADLGPAENNFLTLTNAGKQAADWEVELR